MYYIYMSKILFKNARILKMNGEDIQISNLVVNDNKIEYIGDNYGKYGPFARIIVFFANLHLH